MKCHLLNLGGVGLQGKYRVSDKSGALLFLPCLFEIAIAHMKRSGLWSESNLRAAG